MGKECTLNVKPLERDEEYELKDEVSPIATTIGLLTRLSITKTLILVAPFGFEMKEAELKLEFGLGIGVDYDNHNNENENEMNNSHNGYSSRALSKFMVLQMVILHKIGTIRKEKETTLTRIHNNDMSTYIADCMFVIILFVNFNVFCLFNTRF